MKYNPQPNQYVDPNVTQYTTQPNVNQQPFQPENTNLASPAQMYQQDSYHQSSSSPVVSYEPVGSLDHKGNLHYVNFPTFIIMICLFMLVGVTVVTVLYIIFRDIVTLIIIPFLIFGFVAVVMIVRIEKVTLDKHRRKMYGFTVSLICIFRSRIYNIDFEKIKDIQCEINETVKINAWPAGIGECKVI